MKISRKTYADLYGPTVGDSVRLGDTNLWVTPESDSAVPGDEVTFGGGKSDPRWDEPVPAREQDCMDLVIANALETTGVSSRPMSVSSREGLRRLVSGEPRHPASVTVVIGPEPRSSQARARSSRPGVSTPISTSSARNRLTRRSRPASRPC